MKFFKKNIYKFFCLLCVCSQFFADAPVKDMGLARYPVIDKSMLEDNFAQTSLVDYDAENDYDFAEPAYFKDFKPRSSDIQTQDTQGKNLLMLIAGKDSHKHLMQFIVQNLRTDLQAQDRQGRSALHYAVIGGDFGMVKMLLQHGALLDTQDHEGKTPLYYAVEKNYVRIVDFLVSNGADKKLGVFEDGALPQDMCKTQAMCRLFKKIK